MFLPTYVILSRICSGYSAKIFESTERVVSTILNTQTNAVELEG